MWERLLFLLLCAHLVQFNGSDSFKYDNKNELNKTSSYLIADQFIYGEESLNESYSKSGMGKIRRVRSIEDDLKNAEHEYENLKNASDKADQLVKDAEKEIKDKNVEIGKTEDQLTKIDEQLRNATEKQEIANVMLQNANTYIRIRRVLSEEAEKAEKTSTDEMNKKTAISRIRLASYEEAESVHIDAENVQVAINQIMKSAKSARDDAIKELTTLEGELDTKKGTLKNAITEMAEDKKIVKDYESFTDLEKEQKTKDDAVLAQGKKKTKATENKIPLESMKKWMSETTLVGDPWDEETVVEAITKCDSNIGKAQLLSTDPDPVKAERGKAIIIQETLLKKQLEELQTKFKYNLKLKDFVVEFPDMMFVLKIQIANEDKIIENADTELITLKDPTIQSIRAGKLRALKLLYTSFENLKSEGEKAGKKKDGNSQKFAKARVEVEKQIEKIEEKKALIENLKDEYFVKKTVFDAKSIEVTKAETAKSGADKTNRQALLEFNTYYSNDFKAAKEAKTKSSDQLKKSIEVDYITARRRHGRAEQIMKEKAKIKTELTGRLEKEKSDRDVLIDEKWKRANAAYYALNATSTQNVKVTDLRQDLKDYNVKEEERRGVVRMLKWGLGTTGGILVLLVIGGILAFVLIRRKKKAVKEKKPTRIEFKTEEGLTCIRREGEYDHYCIKGEDFKVMGPLFRGRVHNTIPTKHLLDDQVGGDKIDKITFPTELNEAYFIGEGVEHCEPDSVSISESKGDLFDGIDVSQSKKGKKDKDEKGNEKDAKMNVKDSKGSAPPSSEEKKSDEKNKSKRGSDANAKNGPSSAPDGGNKTEQQQKK